MKRSSPNVIGIIFVTMLVVPAAIAIYFREAKHDYRRLGPLPGKEPVVKLRTPDSKIVEMNMEQYLTGVVSAEMPAAFHDDALTAQAIVARTYAVQWIINNPDTPLSSDYRICQGWESPEASRKKWGIIRYIIYSRKIRKAVSSSRGMIVAYRGHPAETPYHSTSGRFTEDAAEVWGKNVPYLKSARCKWCGRSPRYSETRTITAHELAEAFPEICRGQSSPDLSIVSRNASGRVKSISLGGQIVKGTDFRKALGLNSTNFTVTEQDGKFIIKTTGYGHGVGMCQYGADGMAKDGHSYKSIIEYYYSGTSLVNFY